MGGPFHMPAALALLAGIALFFAALLARLAVLAALLLLLTALFSVGVGVLAAMPWSPLDWARLIVRREYGGG